MSEKNVAVRYAKALCELATESNTVEKVSSELAAFNTFLTGEGHELAHVLENPVFGAEERAKVLSEVLPKSGMSDLTKHFILLLNERDRMSALPSICDEMQKMVDAAAGRVRVQLITAEEASSKLVKEVQQAFETATGKSVVIETSIDSSLIGGMVARMGSVVYDASLKSRLEDIKHRLTNAPAVAEA